EPHVRATLRRRRQSGIVAASLAGRCFCCSRRSTRCVAKCVPVESVRPRAPGATVADAEKRNVNVLDGGRLGGNRVREARDKGAFPRHGRLSLTSGCVKGTLGKAHELPLPPPDGCHSSRARQHPPGRCGNAPERRRAKRG